MTTFASSSSSSSPSFEQGNEGQQYQGSYQGYPTTSVSSYDGETSHVQQYNANDSSSTFVAKAPSSSLLLTKTTLSMMKEAQGWNTLGVDLLSATSRNYSNSPSCAASHPSSSPPCDYQGAAMAFYSCLTILEQLRLRFREHESSCSFSYQQQQQQQQQEDRMDHIHVKMNRRLFPPSNEQEQDQQEQGEANNTSSNTDSSDCCSGSSWNAKDPNHEIFPHTFVFDLPSNQEQESSPSSADATALTGWLIRCELATVFNLGLTYHLAWCESKQHQRRKATAGRLGSTTILRPSTMVNSSITTDDNESQHSLLHKALECYHKVYELVQSTPSDSNHGATHGSANITPHHQGALNVILACCTNAAQAHAHLTARGGSWPQVQLWNQRLWAVLNFSQQYQPGNHQDDGHDDDENDRIRLFRMFFATNVLLNSFPRVTALAA